MVFQSLNQRKKEIQSALFPYEAVSKHNTFEDKSITLTKNLKNLKFRCSKLYHHRLQHYAKYIRSATLSKTKSGKFFLSILLEVDNDEYKKFGKTNERVGIDLGIKDFVITSDGEAFENKHFYKKLEKQIKLSQRQLSKKIKGSNNRNKARIKLARLFEKMSSKKEQYIHYVVNELLTYYDIIFMEDLNTKGMLKNHHLAKAIQEVGFFKFKTVLVDKAITNDKQVHLVGRFYPSSKTCSKCGYINRNLTLNDREWTCHICGEHHNRDINAALNILNEGNRLLSA